MHANTDKSAMTGKLNILFISIKIKHESSLYSSFDNRGGIE